MHGSVNRGRKELVIEIGLFKAKYHMEGLLLVSPVISVQMFPKHDDFIKQYLEQSEHNKKTISNKNAYQHCVALHL